MIFKLKNKHFENFQDSTGIYLIFQVIFPEFDLNFDDFPWFLTILDPGDLQNHPKRLQAAPGDPESSPKTS